MSFDWGLFWQQTQNEAIVALVVFPVVVIAFVIVWLLRR